MSRRSASVALTVTGTIGSSSHCSSTVGSSSHCYEYHFVLALLEAALVVTATATYARHFSYHHYHRRLPDDDIMYDCS